MYNLLMSGGEDRWDTGVAHMEAGRFLEYTHDAIKDRFKSLSNEVIEELKTYPALFAYEKSIDRPARVGTISAIERRASDLLVRFAIDRRFDPVGPEIMQQWLNELDIDPRMEIHRTHWAVKDVSLEHVVTKMGLLISAQPVEAPEFKFSRQTVLRAATILKTLSHANFDAFLLEIGIDAIDAGRNRGSRQARAVVLADYAVRHMSDPTADGDDLGRAIVQRAAQIDADYPNNALFDVDETTRRQFWTSLRSDGYAFVEGHIVAATAIDVVKPQSPLMSKIEERKVFIVHGRDTAAKNDAARFIERIGLEAVILHEQPNGGKTLMNKFMDVASEVAFAIVVMTPDDVGGLSDTTLRKRARQNVIFELGFFIGKLGPSRVCALVAGDVERPSDFEAVVYIDYSPQSDWKNQLARELRHARIVFDATRVF